MAWTHFTDYLAAGDILTKAKRDELLDAVEERMLALCDTARWGWSGDPTVGVRTGHYQLLDSKLATARVKAKYRYFNTDFNAVVRLDELLEGLGQFYAHADDNPQSWETYTGGLMYYAADELGIPAASWDAIIAAVNQGLDQVNYWNVCRRAVMLLEIAFAPVLDTGSQAKAVGGEASWADAKAAFLAASESTTNPGRYSIIETDIFGVDISGDRLQTAMAVPAHAIFASYAAWAFIDNVVPTGYSGGALSMVLEFASVPVTLNDILSVVSLPRKADFGTGLSATGSQSFRAKLKAYEEGTELENFAAGGTVEINASAVIGNQVPGVYLRPTFTHPFQAI